MKEYLNYIEWDSKIFEQNVYEIKYEGVLNCDFIPILDEKCKMESTFMVYIKLYNTDIPGIHCVEKLGFNYMESQYSIELSLNKEYIQSPYSRSFELIELDPHDANSISQILEIIESSFDTDRYYLDPKLDKKISGIRYKNWMINSINDNEYSIYSYQNKKTKKISGFLMIKKESDIIYLALGGIHPDYKGYGIYAGLLIDYLNAEFKKGNKLYYTAISSHNLEIFNIYNYLGFKLIDERIVMRKIYDISYNFKEKL